MLALSQSKSLFEDFDWVKALKGEKIHRQQLLMITERPIHFLFLTDLTILKRH
jgi:hypothetical protein